MPRDDMEDTGQPAQGSGQPRLRFLSRWHGFGCVGLLLLILSAFLLGFNPLQLLGLNPPPADQQMSMPPDHTKAPGSFGCDAKIPTTAYACRVIAAANMTWAKAFPPGKYQGPELVFSAGQGRGQCADTAIASGPFYCPSDRKIYLEGDFTAEVSQRFGAADQPAQAYVIAHALGHHIQYMTGIVDQVQHYQSKLPEAEKTKLRWAIEVQADCYAGVLAAQQKDLLSLARLEAGLRAVHRVADESLPKAAAGHLGSENLALGSLTERRAWLRRGYQAADPDKCDPFSTIRITS